MSALDIIEGVSQEAREKVLGLEALRKEGKNPENFPEVYKQALIKFYTTMEEKNYIEAADTVVLCNTYSKFLSKEEAVAFCAKVKEEFTWGKR